jgi:hypothetical protein
MPATTLLDGLPHCVLDLANDALLSACQQFLEYSQSQQIDL